MTKRLAIVLVGGLLCFGCNSDNPMGPSGTSAPAAAPAAPAAPPKPGAGAKTATPVLYDPRDRAKLPPGVEREPKLAPEVEKLVFSALSATYKARREDCQGAGDVFFRVTASATGAFTAPATHQVAYVAASQACDPAGGGAIEATHLVIVEGDKVVMQASGKRKVSPGESLPFYGTEIRAVLDVDLDGASELMVTATVAAPTGLQEDGRLYTAAGGAIKRVRAFPAAYFDGCAAGPQGKVQAQVAHYVPGSKEGAAQFSSEAYEAACPASGAPKPTDFQPVKAPVAPPASPAASPAASPSPAPTAQPSS